MAQLARRKRGALRTRNRLAALVVASGIALLLSGCSSDGDKGDTGKPTPDASTPAPDKSTKSADPQDAEKQKVLTVYDAMWAEWVKASAKGSEKGTDLEKYASKEALGRAVADLLTMKEGGTGKSGAPKHDAEVTSLDMTADIPKAKIQDCLDISDWKTVDRKSGKVRPFPSEQPLRYYTAVEAEFWKEQKQWMITKVTPNGDRTC